MDSTERLVYEYLTSQGFSDIVYEPDGNVPPDFVIDGLVAIEARRLNQNEETAGRLRGLEQTAIPLRTLIEKQLTSMGPSTTGVSWFVFYTFRRPLPPWKELERALKQTLTEFKDCPSPAPTLTVVTPMFNVRFIRASAVHRDIFVLGGWVDYNSGGFIVAEMSRNLSICIEEKSRKVAKVRHKYQQWWLVLVDYIGYGLTESDREQLRELTKAKGPWDKVILVNPLDVRSSFEL